MVRENDESGQFQSRVTLNMDQEHRDPASCERRLSGSEQTIRSGVVRRDRGK